MQATAYGGADMRSVRPLAGDASINTYEIRFIKTADDDDSKHLVIKLQARSHEEAIPKARDQASKQVGWIGDHGFYSVAVTRYR